MRLLVDTHVLLWAVGAPERLSARARELLEDADTPLVWSAASSWEVAIKWSIGKLRLPEPPDRFVQRHLRRLRVESLPILDVHGLAVAALPPHHKDPFDRLLVAQCRVEGLAALTDDRHFDAYELETVW